MMTGFGMGFGFLGFFLMALFWILVIAGGIWLISNIFPRAAAGGSGQIESAQEILKRRYARGELTKEEFESMRRDLEQ